MATTTYTLVLSCDSNVTLRALPQEDPTKPVVREDRRPLRAMLAEDCEHVHPDALRVVVRLLDSDEAQQATGGLGALDKAGLSRAEHRASTIGVVSIHCRRPAPFFLDAAAVDAVGPAVAEALRQLRLRFRSHIGSWILDRSVGFDAPFADDGSV